MQYKHKYRNVLRNIRLKNADEFESIDNVQ